MINHVKKEENKDFIKKEPTYGTITLSNYIVKRPAQPANVSLYPPLPAQATPISTNLCTVFSTVCTKTTSASVFTVSKVMQSTTVTTTSSKVSSTETKKCPLPTTSSPKKSLKSPPSVKAKKKCLPSDGRPKDVPIVIDQGVKCVLSSPINIANKKPIKPRTAPKDRKNRILKKNFSSNKSTSDIVTDKKIDTKDKPLLNVEKSLNHSQDSNLSETQTSKDISNEPLTFGNKDSKLQPAKKADGRTNNILNSTFNGQLNEEDLLDGEDNMSVMTDLNDMNEDELLNDEEDVNCMCFFSFSSILN